MKTTSRKKPAKDASLRLMQDSIRRRADYSLAVLGMAFVRNGSGQFLNIRVVGDRFLRAPQVPLVTGGAD